MSVLRQMLPEDLMNYCQEHDLLHNTLKDEPHHPEAHHTHHPEMRPPHGFIHRQDPHHRGDYDEYHNHSMAHV
jgi:hypothetical protein